MISKLRKRDFIRQLSCYGYSSIGDREYNERDYYFNTQYVTRQIQRNKRLKSITFCGSVMATFIELDRRAVRSKDNNHVMAIERLRPKVAKYLRAYLSLLDSNMDLLDHDQIALDFELLIRHLNTHEYLFVMPEALARKYMILKLSR